MNKGKRINLISQIGDIENHTSERVIGKIIERKISSIFEKITERIWWKIEDKIGLLKYKGYNDYE